ncbi:MAG TPA: penicillin-binding transpeptidase domain-containing protein [Terriglobales bacterium]
MFRSTLVNRKLLVLIFLLSAIARASDLSHQLAHIMGGRSGTAVVLDLRSGRVMAAYHPDVAARRLARPGSVIKPFTLLALLQSGKLSPTDSLVCRRNLKVGTHDLSCSHPQIGPLQAVSALAYSCNDFFATFGARLTATELQAAFRNSGFTSVTGLMPDEATGSIHLAGTDAERELQAVGEGDVKLTPLEMLAAYRAIALRKAEPTPSVADRVVFEGLEGATTYGMARLAAPLELKVAGKTGTPKANEGHWTNGWFAGYAPAERPEIVVVVFLERGTGPGDAAPLAEEIFSAWWKSKQK